MGALTIITGDKLVSFANNGLIQNIKPTTMQNTLIIVAKTIKNVSTSDP